MKLTGAQALIKSLEMEGTEVMFGLPGGAILPAYDPIIDSPIRHILVRHEQGAGHMAEGYAHVTGRPGVAMVTSGPAATNIVTPLCDAYMDSIPMVAITGQVARAMIGTDAFQECDTVGITRSVTKHNDLVMDPADIPMSCARRSTSPPPAGPARCCSTCPRTCSRPPWTGTGRPTPRSNVACPATSPPPRATRPHDHGGGPADRREPPAR